MNVQLPPDLEKLVETKVQAGQYQSAADVVCDALRLLEKRDEVFLTHKEWIRKEIDEGWEAAQRGELLDGDEVFDRLDAELDAFERSSPK